jgi:RNA polymerase sigma factor (TIGR02999 family)
MVKPVRAPKKKQSQERPAVAIQRDVTGLLSRWRLGDRAAESDLVAYVYPILRAMAQKELASGKLSLHATELAHEAYIRMVQQDTEWESRAHFFTTLAHVLRRVVVDLIRHYQAAKRGRDVNVSGIEWSETNEVGIPESEMDWLALDEALEALEVRDAVAAKVVELRYFAGLSNEEIAGTLNIGVATVIRHWQFARAWLHRRL